MEEELTRQLGDLRRQVEKISPQLLFLVDKFIEFCQGGKRLRGRLVVLGYKIGNRQQATGKDIAKVAAAHEIMHSAILAHDDIIDQSFTRRGRPSLYKAVGMEQAITLADLGFFLAIRIIAESKFEDKLKNQALQIFAQTMMETAIGQMLDISHGDVATARKLKTARYTVAGPLILGATLAGGKLNQLDQFGTYLGIAFQIKDDILDGEAKVEDLANAVKYVNKAKKIIPRLTKDAEMRKTLNELADFMIKRTK